MAETGVTVGDGVQYVWGMPGPDFDEGTVIAVHDDGTFDAYFDPATTMTGRIEAGPTLTGMRLNDKYGIGGTYRITRRPWTPKYPPNHSA